MSRNVTFAPGCYYHIYNRGTEKRDIFLNKDNHERFLGLIYICNNEEPVRLENISSKSLESQQGSTLLKRILKCNRGKTLVEICAFCLMPNHFHFILREKEEGGISKFMQKIMTAYTMYFNKKHNRSGALFQGKFKATLANTDNYLKYLISYVHLNPVKLLDPLWKENGIKDKEEAENYLNTYRYSSYQDYCGMKRLEGALIDKTSLPEYFQNDYTFQIAVTEWLKIAP